MTEGNTTVITIEEPIIQITEEGVEGFEILCRLCANRSDHLIPIYSEEGITNDLADKMNLYLPIKVSKNDPLPLQCCFQCASTVLTWHELVVASVEADKRLREVQSEVEKTIAAQNLINDEAGPSQMIESEDRLISANKDEPKILEECEILTIEYVSDADELDGDNCSKQQTPEIIQIENELVCKYCNRHFKRKCDIVRHIEYCSFKENFIQNSDTTKKRKRRKKTDITAEHFCDVCSKGFTRKYDMLKHRTSQHNVPEKKESNLKQKNLELLQKCKVLNSDGKEYYKCDICNKLIHFSYNFIRHQTIHTGSKPFFCHVCGKNYRMSSTLNRHIRALHLRIKNFACDECGQKFATKSSLEEHKNIHTNVRPFICDICGKNFKQKSSLHVHKLFHTNVFRFPCNVCGKKFRRARELKVHSWMHTGNRPYACKICGSMFRLSQDLKRHSKVHVKKDSEFICVECGAAFSQQRSLKIHKKVHKIKVDSV